jgi:acyl-CoA synthetase (AMP-forming)/AMP-acid ligase II
LIVHCAAHVFQAKRIACDLSPGIGQNVDRSVAWRSEIGSPNVKVPRTHKINRSVLRIGPGSRRKLAVWPGYGTYLSEHFPKWQIPDEVVFCTELPKGKTGKVDKAILRSSLEEVRVEKRR